MEKAIYKPSGKAKEYNQWAVNFYNGCSGSCTYCYNKKGRSAKLLGKDEPTLKKTLIDEKTAIKIFNKELFSNLSELRKNGLFFNFVSDPFLPKTELVNTTAMRWCMIYDVPNIVLTKQTHWVKPFLAEIKENQTIWNYTPKKHLFNIGFTLTGHDEMEPGCATNYDRINTMQTLFDNGINTWASIEPVIDFHSSLNMIFRSLQFCNHYKIGLESGKHFKQSELIQFCNMVNSWVNQINKQPNRNITVYWKDSITSKLPKSSVGFQFEHCVKADYKFWKI